MTKYKLGDLLKIKHGYAFKSENYVKKSQYALVTLANISEQNDFKFNMDKTTFYGGEFPEEYILKENDLIMPLTEQVIGLIGNSAFVPKIEDIIFVLNQRVGKVEYNSNLVDKYYLHFLLATKEVKKQLENRASGTKQRNISPENVYDVEVYIPDLEEQKKIGLLLSNIENKIHYNDQIAENLEELIKIIYQRWFIEYEFPNEEGKPYKTNGGKLVYNEELKREIPVGWIVENCYKNSLYEIIKPGVDFFKTKKYLATGNINDEVISDGNWITYENRESRANMQPINNSVWFAKMKNSIKHLTLTKNSNWFIEKYILSTGFLGVRCREDSLSYIHCFIYSNYFEKVKNMFAHGATQEAVNNEDLKEIKLLNPDKTVLKQFEELTSTILEKKSYILHENQLLVDMKNDLLPLLMNGQIKVEDIKI